MGLHRPRWPGGLLLCGSPLPLLLLLRAAPGPPTISGAWGSFGQPDLPQHLPGQLQIPGSAQALGFGSVVWERRQGSWASLPELSAWAASGGVCPVPMNEPAPS